MFFFGKYIFVSHVTFFKGYKKGSSLLRLCSQVSFFVVVFGFVFFSRLATMPDLTNEFLTPFYSIFSARITFTCFLLPFLIICGTPPQHLLS